MKGAPLDNTAAKAAKSLESNAAAVQCALEALVNHFLNQYSTVSHHSKLVIISISLSPYFTRCVACAVK